MNVHNAVINEQIIAFCSLDFLFQIYKKKKNNFTWNRCRSYNIIRKNVYAFVYFFYCFYFLKITSNIEYINGRVEGN